MDSILKNYTRYVIRPPLTTGEVTSGELTSGEITTGEATTGLATTGNVLMTSGGKVVT